VPLNFDWEAAKAESNLAKHRVSFDDAIEVFADPLVAVVATIREQDREERFKAIGRIAHRLFTIVYTERDGGKRIISARPSNRNEKKRYNDRPPHA
jgi:uncharacterized DUF497 family protein